MFKNITKQDKHRIPLIAALMLLCVGIEYYIHMVHGITMVYLHFFYFPVILAALWWGVKGAMPVSLFLATIHSISYFSVDASDIGLRSVMLVFTGLMTGITADRHYRSQKALLESKSRFKDMALSSSDWIWEIDKDGKYTFVSEGVKKILGYEPSEVIGKSPFDLMSDDETQRVRDSFMSILADQQPIIDLENWNLTKKNEQVCLLTNGLPVFDKNGALTGYRGVDKNITPQKQAEQALERSEEDLRTIIDTIQTGIVVIDPRTHCVVNVNSSAAEMIGTSKDQIIGKVCHKVMTTTKCGECPITDLNQTVYNSEKELSTTDGGILPILKSVVRVRLSGHDYLVESFVSIADRKKREEELRRTSKLESLGVLAGGIAHDFNNVLTGILGHISLVKYDLDPEERAHKLLEKAEKATEEAKHLTQQLLTFAKGGDPVKQGASVEELIRSSASFVLRGSNVKPLFSFADDLRPAEVDTGQISQVIQNLTLNASQAMLNGGDVTINAENVTIEPGEFESLESGQYVRISIADKGIGMSQDQMQRIFDPYFTTKETGNGIGLAVTYSIIKKHKGHIEVESEIGEGTTFSVYLPSCEGNCETPNETEEEISVGGGNILVMDDEKMLTDIVSLVLSRFGYTVDSASHGAEAIKLYEVSMVTGKPYDVVLLDLTVPGRMGGLETAKRLREMAPDVKTIVCSGYSSDPVLANFEEYGFCGAVSKPYKAADLVKAVKALSDRKNCTGLPQLKGK